ncbi:MAG: signal peptidase [Patescibacteria group bacterium]|nr:signal peptidase [Patescibacteria group bacterium]
MNPNLRMKHIVLSFPILFLISIDQLSKYIIRVKGGFYICNTDLAFGLKPSYFLVFAIILIAILSLVAVGNSKFKITNFKQITISKCKTQKSLWFEKFEFVILNLFGIWSFGFGILLIASGAISNIIDRVLYGCVIDFIDLHFWPVFNLADAFITIGGIMIIMKHVAYNTKQP